MVSSLTNIRPITVHEAMKKFGWSEPTTRKTIREGRFPGATYVPPSRSDDNSRGTYIIDGDYLDYWIKTVLHKEIAPYEVMKNFLEYGCTCGCHRKEVTE